MPGFASLQSALEVIDALGGTNLVYQKYKVGSYQVVSNWRYRGRISHEFFLRMQADLEKLGHTAPPEIWSILPVETSPLPRRVVRR